jgi:hypothetical protein
MIFSISMLSAVLGEAASFQRISELVAVIVRKQVGHLLGNGCGIWRDEIG